MVRPKNVYSLLLSKQSELELFDKERGQECQNLDV